MNDPVASLREVETAVQAALAAGTDADLRILGYGEITLVIGWPTDRPVVACKRLPVFPSASVADRYAERFEHHLTVLADRGVVAVPSALRVLRGPRRGERVGYVVQPVMAPGTLGPDVLRGADPDPDHPLLRAVCEVVPEVVDDRTGFDGQISNWAYGDDGVQYLDVTTPMLFDGQGRIELDTGLFLAAYPWLLRWPIGRFVAPGVVGAYRDARHVLLDLVANLRKERLDDWVPAAVTAANRVIGTSPGGPITAEEARRYYRSDARLWEAMLRLRRADRWWQIHVRHRTYPFLLPGQIDR